VGVFASFKTNKQLGEVVQRILASQELGPEYLLVAFREGRSDAYRVRSSLAGKVSISATFRDAHAKTLVAADTIIAAADAYEASCIIEGDRLKSWNPEVAAKSVSAVISAWNLAIG
jgi:hypothetical protein